MVLISSLKHDIHWKVLGQSVLILLPVLFGFLIFHDILLFNVGLIAISLFIVMKRLNLNLYLITLHFLLILLLFSILFYSFNFPYLFVAVCAILGFFTVYCTQHGVDLRTFANYTFIPVVYLACELHEKEFSFNIYSHFIALTPIALITLWIFYFFDSKTKKKKAIHFGNPETQWIQPALAIFFGVAIAAALVVIFNISRGEWVIWSVASVITIEIASSVKKFQQRVLGVLIGVPLGFVVGVFLPNTQVVYSLATLAIMLTLVAFKPYQLAFGTRCFFISLAAYVASATPTIAIERIANVILGGIIGMIAIFIIHLIYKRSSRNRVH